MTGPDRYWQVVCQEYNHVLSLYRQYADKRPVMLFDIQEQRIYAYPYREFAADLSEKSQRSLALQYQAAGQNGQMVVFVRDNVDRRFVSYTVACEQPTTTAALLPAPRLSRRPKPAGRSAAGAPSARAGRTKKSKS